MPATQRRPTAVRVSFYEQHIRSRIPLLLGAAVAVFTLLYWLGVVGEELAATVFAAAVIVGCSAYGFAKLFEAVSSRALAYVLVALCLATSAVAIVPVFQTLIPGTPAARGRLSNPGDALRLPESTHGAIRVLMHGNLPGRTASAADVVLDFEGQGQVLGQLSRTFNRARVGRRGQTMVMHEHTSDYVAAELPPGVHRLSLARIDGTLAGPLDVAIFPERGLPLPVEIALACALLLLAAALAARMDAPRAGVGGLAAAMGFGLLVSRMATPDEAVGPEIGALFMSLVGATLIAGMSVWLLRKLVGARPMPASVKRPAR